MFYLLILLLQMKLIKQITDLNKAINKEKRLGFVPTMGCLHEGHEALIKISKNTYQKEKNENYKKVVIFNFNNIYNPFIC